MTNVMARLPLQPAEYGSMLSVALIKGAQSTTAIEGNTLTEEEIESLVSGRSLPPSKQYQEQEVRNVLDAMNSILREIAEHGRTQVISRELLLRFHHQIGRNLGEHFDANPGELRTDVRVVGGYRSPPAQEVGELVDRLCDWLKLEFGYEAGNRSFTNAVIESIVSHVYLEWIHPFGDGNGRTGRLLEFYILLRAGLPDVCSHILSNHYNLTRSEYYRQLANATKKKDLSDFLSYAIEGLSDGLGETLDRALDSQFRNAWRSYIYDQFAQHQYRKTIFKRRREFILNFPLYETIELHQITGISIEVARQYASLSQRTLLRDIGFLLEIGLLVEVGTRMFEANTDTLLGQMPKRLLDRE